MLVIFKKILDAHLLCSRKLLSLVKIVCTPFFLNIV
jgi:hypothetical protein